MCPSKGLEQGVGTSLLARVSEVYSYIPACSDRFEQKVLIQAGGDGHAERGEQRE